MAESAFFVPVPEAEPWVRFLRERYDPVASLGVPAHITVLVPFMSPELITEPVLAKIIDIIQPIKSFEFTLQRVARFPETVYLIPEPAEPFISLTAALVREFPDYPPYSGRFPEVAPHLTVADRSAELSSVAEVELAVIMKERGPIHAKCDLIELFENSGGRWRRAHSFPLPGDV